MSYEAVRWAMYDAPMLLTAAGKPDTASRAVLIARAERADAKGRNTYAGPADLMKSTGYDERTVQRADRRLEQAGLLIRDGFSHIGTVRWRLAMDRKLSDGEKATPDPRIEQRREADKVRQQRARDRRKASASIEPDVSTKNPVTDSASVTSRISNPDVTDSASGRHGFNAPQTTHEPPGEPPGGTTPGGTLPPGPLRPPSPSAPGTDQQNSLTDALTPAQDQQSESLPHAREPAPPTPDPPRPTKCDHGIKIRIRTDGASSCALCRREQAAAGPPEHEPPPTRPRRCDHTPLPGKDRCRTCAAERPRNVIDLDSRRAS